MNKIHKELKALGDIENAFKELGKRLYAYWLDDVEVVKFEPIMKNFDCVIRELMSKKSKFKRGEKNDS